MTLEDTLAYFIFTAALFGLRKRKDKALEEWKLFWAFHVQLGNPCLPLTASWCQR